MHACMLVSVCVCFNVCSYECVHALALAGSEHAHSTHALFNKRNSHVLSHHTNEKKPWLHTCQLQANPWGLIPHESKANKSGPTLWCSSQQHPLVLPACFSGPSFACGLAFTTNTAQQLLPQGQQRTHLPCHAPDPLQRTSTHLPPSRSRIRACAC